MEKWICNECNFPNFTGSVSVDDIEQEKLSCINCGCFEFHLLVSPEEESNEDELLESFFEFLYTCNFENHTYDHKTLKLFFNQSQFIITRKNK